MKRTVAIVHYNTPELTRAAILSLRKHGGRDYHVVVFDNSDKRPFGTPEELLGDVKVIDNTHGQFIDFAAELSKYPERQADAGAQNGWGSDKHMMSVQKLWELLPDGFLLMDSDVLVKGNVDFMFMEGQCVCGHIQDPQPGNRFSISRLVPMLCYINVPLCESCGVRYWDPERSWMLYADVNDKRNWYDTGASFLEDVKSHMNGARGKRIDIRPLMEHFKCGSWRRNDRWMQEEWLKLHKELWQPTPRQRGVKDIAICAIGRMENRYAREWVEHYKQLGVSKIIIYDNYFGDEERLADVLGDYVESGLVVIKSVPNMPDYQCRAYNQCYMEYGSEYAWIGFLDFDEFLRWPGKKKIKTMFERYTEGNVLLINWRIMTDNGLVRYDDRPLKERFTEAMPVDRCVKYNIPEDNHVKCFVRGGLTGVDFGNNPHCPKNDLMFINTKGERVERSPFTECDHSVMRIDHYWTKTAEEWRTKLRRGFPCSQQYTDRFRQKQESYFFAVNERTEEKEIMLG